ncbi:MAG: aminotransferase class V-fold PLP-dependent enzyme [Oligoflexia bacterium]|nr:aminotransferase class V-fold PLP-dependent enzyme [Oligoflexia bacterium]
MERLISSRIYLDYNATSPFAPSVLDWLAKGDLLFGNPSSVHSVGKKSLRGMNQVKEYLFKTFGLSDNDYDIFFHSGATEGANTIIKGRASYLNQELKQVLPFYYFQTDHSCIHNSSDCLDKAGMPITSLPVKEDGSFYYDQVVGEINKNKKQALLNYTWVNNETGVIFPLEEAVKIKEATGCHVHVDAVQSVGKISDWNKLDNRIDAYTFSAHKFGALKGVGFTFYKKNFEMCPLIRGGGQQGGLRSGTENILGIQSIPFALDDVKEKFDPRKSKEAKDWFEKELSNLLGDQGEIVGSKNENRNLQTTYFITYKVKAHTLSMALDMAGVDVSNGSACSSGAVIPSRVLMAMGYSEDYSKSAIRVSFSHSFDMEEAKVAFEKLSNVLQRYLS